MIVRAQVSVWRDSLEPTNALQINPCFESIGPTADWQDFAEDLGDALAAYWDVGTGQQQVKIYDAQGTPPVFPVGDAKKNWGINVASTFDREQAACLSFYHDHPIPRQRGRLYLPLCLTSPSALTQPQLTSGMQSKAAALVPILAGAGGFDIDWVVYSKTNDEAYRVTHWFVDNAIDHVRSRGLAPSGRIAGTTSG
jgi:hypothetical protein